MVHVALIAYALGAASFLAWLLRPTARRARAGRWLLAGGALLHAGALVLGPGLATLGVGSAAWRGGQIFSLLGVLTVGGYLWVDRGGANTLAGTFVAPLAIVLMAPAHFVSSSERAVAPQLATSLALFVHVATSAFGSAALLLAMSLALLYLAGDRQAKTKRTGRLFSRLTSLDAIDRAAYRVSVWGFIFLSIANVTGAVVSSSRSGAPLSFVSKQVFAILAWALLAAMIQTRLVSGWRGRRSAVLVLLGTGLLACVYVALLSGPVAGPLAAVMAVWP